jgi:hypothetical protein
MKKKDRVILRKPLGPCDPGCEGFIVDVDPHGNVTVEITHDQNCNKFVFLLPPKPADYYIRGSKCIA